MKYWRGYLVAAILAVLTWALIMFAASFSTLVDSFYPYLTRTVQDFLAGWSAGVDFCVWQLGVVLLIAVLLATIVLMIIFRWNFVQWLGWVLAAAMSIALLHTGLYGLNYHAGPLSDDLRMGVYQYSIEDLQEATLYYRDKANELALQMPRNEDGSLKLGSFEELAALSGAGFADLTYEQGYSVFAGKTTYEVEDGENKTTLNIPIKKLDWADMYTAMGITGITMPITGEVAVNPQIPAIALPFTMCHELAHRMCIAQERDANFAAFLACRANDDLQFQYSAYFMAYRYCYSALYSQTTAGATVAAARIHAEVNAYFARDLKDYDAFFEENVTDTASSLASSVNDAYIKTSGDEAGVNSYGEVCDLLVNLYINENLLADRDQGEGNSFDPMDENQVDLSGIVGAMPRN